MSKVLSSKDSRFKWPRNTEKAKAISREQFVWLMQGLAIEQPKVIKKTTENMICTDDFSTE